MDLDIKIPIGLMFTILGVILTIMGFVTSGNAEMYEKSLGHNLNLWTGILMLIFGAFMLVAAYLSKKRKLSDE